MIIPFTLAYPETGINNKSLNDQNTSEVEGFYFASLVDIMYTRNLRTNWENFSKEKGDEKNKNIKTIENFSIFGIFISLNCYM